MDAFRPPSPLQLSLVLVVADTFPAVVGITTPPTKCEAEELQEKEETVEVCCICCNCNFVLSLSVCPFVRFLLGLHGALDSFFHWVVLLQDIADCPSDGESVDEIGRFFVVLLSRGTAFVFLL